VLKLKKNNSGAKSLTCPHNQKSRRLRSGDPAGQESPRPIHFPPKVTQALSDNAKERTLFPMMNEPRVLCLVNMYTWSDGKQIAVPGSFSVFEGCCVQEDASIVGKPDLDVAPRQCVG